jgi:hypothetical protein
MSTVEEIEEAAEKLGPTEFARLAAWVSARNHELWTRQMDRDATAGKLDFLFDEAETERHSGQLHDWPSDQK